MALGRNWWAVSSGSCRARSSMAAAATPGVARPPRVAS